MSNINTLDLALDYLKRYPNRYLAPLKRGSKSQPLIKNNLAGASNDPKQIRGWYAKFPGCNWLVSLKKSGLLAVDVDNKPGKKGQTTWDMLDLEYGWPETERARSPSGGYHDLYIGEHVMRVNGFGENVDSPNFVVMPGCPRADGGRYTLERDVPAAKAPEWFYGPTLLGKAKQKQIDVGDKIVSEDRDYNVEWAIDFLKNDADPAIEGQGGDFQTLKTAMSLRDKSIAFETAVDLMARYYNDRCIPAWDYDDLRKKVENAYSYASQSRMGETAVESTFAEDQDGVDLDLLPGMSPEEAAPQIAQIKAGIDRDRGGAKKLTRDQVLERYAFVASINRYIKLSDPTSSMLKKEAFDDYFRYLNKGSLAKDLLMMKTGGMRRFEALGYEPGGPRTLKNGALNLYTEPKIKPSPGDVTWWTDHIAYLFPDEQDRKHLTNWLAWFYQNIAAKPKHVLLIQGREKGTGKSFIADLMARLVDEANRSVVTQADLADSFNGYAMRAKLLTIEELHAVEKGVVKEKLHAMITQERISINEKNLPKFDTDNRFGIIATSNEVIPIRMDDGDRRYLVLRTHAKRQDTAYYAALMAKLSDPDALAAFADHLLKWDCGEYTGAAAAPDTEAKSDMIKLSGSDCLILLKQFEGEYPLRGSVLRWADLPNLGRTISPNALSAALIELGWRQDRQYSIRGIGRPMLWMHQARFEQRQAARMLADKLSRESVVDAFTNERAEAEAEARKNEFVEESKPVALLPKPGDYGDLGL